MFRSDLEALRWWDSIVLSEGEKRVLECLSILAPVDAIAAAGQAGDGVTRGFRVRLRTTTRGVPMQSVGHGVIRMFHIALAAEQLKDQDRMESESVEDANGDARWPFLLIDEIENGIYHGVLRDLWRFVFRLAGLNQLQVFVTTHSADCVDAFLRISEEDSGVGQLIRLEGKDDKRRSVLMEEADFPVIRESHIEVR